MTTESHVFDTLVLMSSISLVLCVLLAQEELTSDILGGSVGDVGGPGGPGHGSRRFGASASNGAGGVVGGGGGGGGSRGLSMGGGSDGNSQREYACKGQSVYELDVIYDRNLYARPMESAPEGKLLMFQGSCGGCGRCWARKWYCQSDVDECASCYHKRLRTMKEGGGSPSGRRGKGRHNRNFILCRERTRKVLLDHHSRGIRPPPTFPMFNPGMCVWHTRKCLEIEARASASAQALVYHRD